MTMYQHFFFPDRVKYGSPADAGFAFTPIRFASHDGITLSAWWLPAQGGYSNQAASTVLHLHGNAQNMTAHWVYAAPFVAAGFNVMTLDYRGYGDSEGRPDPEGILADARAALDYLQGREDVGSVCVFGQSLGGMLAIAAAALSPAGVHAVVAEAPAHSYSLWAEDQMPQLELSLDDSACASTYIAKLSPIPLMLIHGTADRVVPFSHSEALLALAGEPKRLIRLEGGHHNEAMNDPANVAQVIEFFRAACDN